MRQYDVPGGVDPERTSNFEDSDTAEIRVEIEQTRTEMSGTIDAIQQKLAPEVLTEQAKDVARDAADQAKAAAQEVLEQAVREVKDAAVEVTEHAVHEVKEAAREVTGEAKDAAWDATIGRAEVAVSSAGQTARGVGSDVIETIKQNPVPAALAGLGLYWLYRNRATGSTGSGALYSSTRYPAGPYQAYPVRATYESPTYPSPAYDAGRTASGSQSQGTVGKVADTVSGAASQAGDVASDVASSVASTAGQVASTAGQVASSAGETVVDTGSSVMDLIRNNPMPAALIGIGLGWLYMNRSSGGPDYRAHSRDHYRYGPQAVAQAYGTSGSQASGGSQGGVGSVARQAGQSASEMAGGVTEQAGEMAGAVVDRASRAPGQIQRMIEENPLMAAALAASVGAAVGLALPPTRAEDRLVGSSRDRAMGRAEEATREAIDKVQSVADEVQTTAAKESRSQGLTV